MKKLFIGAFALLSVFVTSCGDDDETPVNNENEIYSTLPQYVVEAIENAKLICPEIGTIVRTPEPYNGEYYVYDENNRRLVIDEYGNVELSHAGVSLPFIHWTVREGKIANNDDVNNTIWHGRSEAVENIDENNEEAKGLYAFISKYAQYETSTTEKEETIITDELSGTDEIRFLNTTCVLSLLDTATTYECKYLKKYRRVNVKSQIITADNNMYKLTVDNVDRTVELNLYHFANDKDTTAGYYMSREYIADSDTDNSFCFVEDSVLLSKKFVSSKKRVNNMAYCYRQLDNKLYLYLSDGRLEDNKYIKESNTITLNIPFEYNSIHKERVVFKKK